jgi:tetratricopeptide (TPR) repeat protein
MKKILFLFLLPLTCFTHAQTDTLPFPPLSSNTTIAQSVGNTLITVEYERPLARERKIFGELVPWNKVWRTGAGQCTRIGFAEDVLVQGKKIAAGKYSLFTIPNPDKWIIILNSDTSLYGSYDYNSNKDVIRFEVIPTNTYRHYEAFTIDIDLIKTNANIYLAWVNTQVVFNIETNTSKNADRFIREQLLSGKNTNSGDYFTAAQYLLYQRQDLQQALILADKSLQLDKYEGGAREVKMQIYEILHQYDNAKNEVIKAIEMTKTRKYHNEGDKQQEINFWETQLKRIGAQQ